MNLRPKLLSDLRFELSYWLRCKLLSYSEPAQVTAIYVLFNNT